MKNHHNVDIIGGSGFIGSNLCMHMDKANCYDIRIIDKKMSPFYNDLVTLGDVRSIDDLRKNIREESVIINLAAEHRDDVRPKSLYYEVNVEGAKNIATVASQKNINKIIFTSSVAVYGFTEKETDEGGPIRPFNDYGQSKYEAENILRRWQSEKPDLRTLVIIRPTVVFGERNRGNVYNLFAQIYSKRFIMVGNGTNKKSMAYVGNVVSFIDYCIALQPGIHLFNYADKPDYSMSDLIVKVNLALSRSYDANIKIPYKIGLTAGKVCDLYSTISGKKLSLSSIRVQKFCANTIFKTSANITQFSAPYTLDEAIDKTIRFEFIDNKPDNIEFITE